MTWIVTLAAYDLSSLSPFLWVVLVLAIVMLLWDTVEVGRNDAANLVNAAYGARVMTQKWAVIVAGTGCVLGATFSSDVIDTARKGIFNPAMLRAMDNPLHTALAIYISVYIVDTVLLYGYSSFGMPVSTTATLVFSLLGAAFAVGGNDMVNWSKAGKVVTAIVMSIVISGIAGFMVQRAVRGAMRDRAHRLNVQLLHGGWAGGGMLAMLTFFMIVKGMKHVSAVKWFKANIIDYWGAAPVVFILWAIYAIIIHACLVFFRERASRRLFPILVILGTFCMGFAFGQNDLANCASPGLSALSLIKNRQVGVELGYKVQIESWKLFCCGLLLFAGMMTSGAKRVTNAAAATGSMSHNVALYAPRWCQSIARYFLRFRAEASTLAPPPTVPETGEGRDYDALRACVILGVSACVIATASSLGLPVSTTYVTFAAIVATGMADRIFQRGDADLKLARTIWVIFSWFSAALIAMVFAGIVCKSIASYELNGIFAMLGVNFTLRFYLGRRGSAQEALMAEQAEERQFPEQFTDDLD